LRWFMSRLPIDGILVFDKEESTSLRSVVVR
jgi:hypothetical protein